ncbi:hypothetical protein KBI52_02105, partial [Microvirga sp. HBU67558]|uniref:hypothetical protein n=1 Tax=Microvirga sp. HBU67558 TaxID=2824562 RepID=UPI001B385580
GTGDLRLELTCDAGHLANPDRSNKVSEPGKKLRSGPACPGEGWGMGQDLASLSANFKQSIRAASLV